MISFLFPCHFKIPGRRSLPGHLVSLRNIWVLGFTTVLTETLIILLCPFGFWQWITEFPSYVSFLDTHSFLFRFNYNDFWIGLKLRHYDLPTQVYTYKFVDDTTASYLPWKAGEPNLRLIEECIRLTPDTLHFQTTSCSKTHRFFCEGKELLQYQINQIECKCKAQKMFIPIQGPKLTKLLKQL